MIRVTKLHDDNFCIEPLEKDVNFSAGHLPLSRLPKGIRAGMATLSLSGDRQEGIGVRICSNVWELDDTCLRSLD